ncbi:citrate synthase-like protein [Globomyces pollinis-pini]|nr:citrate synthase-like protein [Globomyces pollinis-pini]
MRKKCTRPWKRATNLTIRLFLKVGDHQRILDNFFVFSCPMTRILKVKESSSGMTLEIPVKNDAVNATYFAKLKIDSTTPAINEKVPVRLFDPGFKNTAVANSAISFVDGENGKLYYRGYDLEDLIEKSTYLEVSYLLIHGELPTESQLANWSGNILRHTYLHSQIERQMGTFRYDAHPMGMMIATISSLSTFHPDSNPAIQRGSLYSLPVETPGVELSPEDKKQKQFAINNRSKVIYRMLGKIPTIAANTYRHRMGRTYNHPMPHSQNYCENLLFMMDKLDEPNYVPDSRLVKILDKMFILMAENGVNCSTVMIRHLTSSGVDPYTALSGAAGALFGERKGSAVVDMLKKIGTVENIDEFLNSIKKSSRSSMIASGETPVKNKSARLMGFGHRIYKTIDPRVRICKQLTLELFDLLGCNDVAKVALALEEKALQDQWFTSRNLYPNIDFWTAILFDTLDFPTDMFPVWMFIPRVSGFIAHLIESMDDPEYKIFRPRQIYTGEFQREYESLDHQNSKPKIESAGRKLFRPKSFIGQKIDLPDYSGNNINAEEDIDEDDENELDFTDQFAKNEKSRKPTKRIRQWMQKAFKSNDNSDNSVIQDMFSQMSKEIQQLKLKQDEFSLLVVNGTPAPTPSTPMQVNDMDFENKLTTTATADQTSSTRKGSTDLLAGSSHSRVISSSNAKLHPQ